MLDYNSILQQQITGLQTAGRYRYFLDVHKNAATFPRFHYTDAAGNQHSAINWCSNDYLCMSVHPTVISKLCETAKSSGSGSGGTRNISGTTQYHQQLEKALAGLHGQQSALVFGGAYIANLTALSTLGKLLPGAVFLSDEENHASMIEGIRSSGCSKYIFQHNDTMQLENILQSLPVDTPKIIAIESVYSISGSVAPLQAIVSLAKQYNCLMYVDEVHAVGLYGATGGGLTEQLGLQQQVDIINGTLAKGFGLIGGYIAASATIVDVIRSFGSGFIFTTSLPPATCAAAIESVGWLQQHTEVRQQFHQKVQQLRSILRSEGILFNDNPTHITPVVIGDETLCRQVATTLLQECGLYLQPVNYPTVPKGKACLRIVVNSRHTEYDMLQLAKGLKKVLPAHLLQPLQPQNHLLKRALAS